MRSWPSPPTRGVDAGPGVHHDPRQPVLRHRGAGLRRQRRPGHGRRRRDGAGPAAARQTRAALEQLAVVPTRVPPTARLGAASATSACSRRPSGGGSSRCAPTASRSATSWPVGPCCAASRGPGRSPCTRTCCVHCSSRSSRTCPGSCTTRWRPATSPRCSAAGRRRPGRPPRAGSHRQALAHYEQVVKHLALLPPEDAGPGAGRLQPGSSTSPSAGTTRCGPAARALTLCESLGDPGGRGRRQGRALAQSFMAGRPGRGGPRGRARRRGAASPPATSRRSPTPRPTSARCRR